MQIEQDGYTITRAKDHEGYYFEVTRDGYYMFSTHTLRDARTILNLRDETGGTRND